MESDTRFSTLGFFRKSVFARPLIIPLGPFWIFTKILEDIRKQRLITGALRAVWKGGKKSLQLIFMPFLPFPKIFMSFSSSSLDYFSLLIISADILSSSFHFSEPFSLYPLLSVDILSSSSYFIRYFRLLFPHSADILVVGTPAGQLPSH